MPLTVHNFPGVGPQMQRSLPLALPRALVPARWRWVAGEEDFLDVWLERVAIGNEINRTRAPQAPNEQEILPLGQGGEVAWMYSIEM